MSKLSARGRVEGRPKRFTDPVAFAEKVDAFFDNCDLKEEPYTVSGLCLWLEVSRKILSDYGEDDEFRNTIIKAKNKVENYTERMALMGKANPTFAIFSLKNNFGWEDKRSVETADVSKDKYEAWLRENQKTLDVTPDVKTIEGDVSSLDE